MTAQSLAALERANEVRLARSTVKRGIREGRISLQQAMDLECIQSMKVFDLLQSQRYWGSSGKSASTGVRAVQTLSRLHISPYRRIEDLTSRQRVLLCSGKTGDEQ